MRIRRLDTSSRPFVLLTALTFVLSSGSALADPGDPEMATSGSLEDHQAEYEDPEDLEAESHDMVEGYSEDPEDLVVEASEEHVVDTEDLEDHEGHTTGLQDLEMAAPDPGFEEIEDGRLTSLDVTNLNAQQVVAMHHLDRAQSAAVVARTRYGDMMRDDYPRGAARLRIVEHRDETMRDLEKARAEFDAAMGN
jgi:hypothetical protein